MSKKLWLGCVVFCGIGFVVAANALEFSLPESGNDIVGEEQVVKATPGQTLSSIGMKYDIGFYEMVEANPDLPKVGAIKVGSDVLIPSRFILPQVRQGLVVNLAELRVYYFPKNKPEVYTFPIGAGQEGWNTPQAKTTVIDKKKDPVWIVPDSIMEESIKAGKPLKKVYLPGPNNPLGDYALYLGLPGIRIHGTNLQPTVGRRISHGCIRLFADDIKFLYENVPVGTPVVITHEENKVGWLNHVLYLEAEVPFVEYHDSESAEKAIEKAIGHRHAVVDWALVKQVLEDQYGMPEAIGHDMTIPSIPEDAMKETLVEGPVPGAQEAALTDEPSLG